MDVAEWLKACDICKHNKPGGGKGRYPLTQDLASAPIDTVAIDIMGHSKTTSSGKQYILVPQSFFSNLIEIWSLPNH